MSAPIVHFEITGPDGPELVEFYRALHGWEVRDMGPGYSLVSTPDGSPNGAIRESEGAELTVGIGVDDLEATLAAATTAGATIVMPATDNGGVNKAQIADPAGNLVTLIENARSE